MATDLHGLEAAAGLAWFLESRGLEAGSRAAGLVAAWFAENRPGDPLVFAELLDAELARFRRGDGTPG